MIYSPRMDLFLQQPVAAAAIHFVNAALAFASAIGISSAVSMNRGARMNVAWVLIAAGLILIGISQASVALEAMGLPLLPDWDGIKAGLGLLLVLIGALHGRSLLKKALK